jgi:amino acid adenylation domain-containing protein
MSSADEAAARHGPAQSPGPALDGSVVSCLHELVEMQVRRSPHAVAVAHRGQKLSYNSLDGRANRLADELRDVGVRPEATVAVRLEPSVDLLIALLAVLKAGGAYVPIAPATPQRRLQHIVADTRALVLLTTTALGAQLPDLACPVLAVDAVASIGEPTAGGLKDRAVPDNLAYVLYTSGSTGTPKGVMIPHRGICNTLIWRQDSFPFTADDRVLLTFSFAFDASIFELFQPLIAGASVVIPDSDLGGDPERVIDAIRRHSITVLGAVPSWLAQLATRPDLPLCDSLRIVFSGGEPLTEDLVGSLRAAIDVEVVNVYGPTEASMEATSWTWTAGSPISIGRPVRNMRAYILDEDLDPVPVGIVGDLYLAGAGLARGYLGAPATTAESFVPKPFDGSTGARMYRTGDRCRWRSDRSLEYVGRDDQQIKVGGQRVELGEIEATLLQHEDVAESVVQLREPVHGKRVLVAYVVPAGQAAPNQEELKRHLALRLPRYMIPRVFEFLESIPRTAAGKVDRVTISTLPHPGSPPGANQAPSTPLERLLTKLWSELLGVDAIGIDDDFFDLGGDSIHAAILAHRLEAELEEFVYSVAIYDAPTIRELAAYLFATYREATRRFLPSDAPRALTPVSTGVSDADITTLRQAIRTLPRGTALTSGPKNSCAVFILSPPRCGSTLLRTMLGAHPALFAPPELQLLNYHTLRERSAALASARDGFWLQGTVRALMELFRCDAETADRIMDNCERRDMSVKDFYRLLQERLGEITLVDKTPTYTLDRQVLERAEDNFDAPLYIHLVRHPSAAIGSFEEARLQVFFPPFLRADHQFSSAQLAELIWVVCNQNILEFLSGIPDRRQHLVRFEDLVRHPEDTATKLAAFLGLPFDTNMINPYQQDQRVLMTDGVRPLARMLGDVKFHQHTGIDASAAERTLGHGREAALGEVTRRVAASLGYRLRQHGNSVLVALQKRGAAPPLFCVHPASGSPSGYRALARELGSQQPLYAFGAHERDGSAITSVEGLASFYLQELQGVQPHGPYQLGGWSFGGLVAFEMALQLTAEGEEVALLSLFSSHLPRPRGASPPVRSREFVVDFVREHGWDAGLPVGDRSSLDLLKFAFVKAKRAGVVAPSVGFHEFHRVMARHSRTYRHHIELARLYTPRGRLETLVLFEADDPGGNGHSPSVEWETVTSQVSRHVVPGNHFTMLHPPNVGHVVRVLVPYLSRASGRGGRRDA